MDIIKTANFLFELGSLRKVARSHRQKLLTDDLSDNIASHSFRVVHIGYILAKISGADPYKVIMMCMFHDVGEARSGDLNRTQKRYVKVDDHKLRQEQLDKVFVDDEVDNILDEYEDRQSLESQIAKDADRIDQLLLVKEYTKQGVEIDKYWFKTKEVAVDRCTTDAGKQLIARVYDTDPYSWRYDLD